MNKRMRKKQITRYEKQQVRDLKEWSRFYITDWQLRIAFLLHKRRAWLTKQEFTQRKAQFDADMMADRAYVQEKLKTHNYTLGGWMPKEKA